MTWRTSLLTVGLFVVFFNIIAGHTGHTTTGHTTSSPLCMDPADVIFALDASGSVGAQNFNTTLDFVKNVVDRIIDVGPNGINIGILTFSSVSRVQFHLKTYTTQEDLRAAIGNISYNGGGTYIAHAIVTMRAMFAQGGRNNATRYGVVITDGKSSHGDAPAEADVARDANITMLAVGIGTGIAMRELKGIANKPSAGFVYNVGYNNLMLLLDVIQDITDCDDKTDLTGVDIGQPCTPIKTCVKNNTECSATDTNHTICRCSPGYQLRIINGQKECETVDDACALGEICYNNTNCITNSECIYDGSNSATTRCLCNYGYVHAVHNGICQCAAVITTPVDPDCDDCESNGGVCYDANGDQQKDGCVCPSFKSQPDCEKSHVSVMCNATTHSMTICYEEQEQYKATGAVVLVEGKGMKPACRAIKVGPSTPDSVCPVGQHQLVLPCADSKLAICGTTRLLYDINTLRFQSKILVQHHVMDMHPGDVSFMAFCSCNLHANVRFGPIGVAVATEERGNHHRPTLTLYVENNRGIPLVNNKAIRLGDWISFRIHLLRDGTYTAIRVLQCLASSKARLPDRTAVTLPLVVNSCPSPGQSHITDKNNWKRVSGKPFELRTGRLRMFKLSEGHSVHVHCMVQLCLLGAEDDCGKVNCTHPAEHSSYGRRKRSTSANFRLSKTLTWYDKEQNSLTKDIEVLQSSSVFGGILSILGVAIIVFVAIVTSLIWKTRFQPKPKNQGCSSR